MISLVNILTCFFEALTTMMLINAYTEKSTYISTRKHIISVLVLGVLFNLCNYFAGIVFSNMMFMWLATVVVSYFYNHKVKINVVISIMSMVLLAVAEILVLFLLTVIFDISVAEATNTNFRLLGIFISKLLFFSIVKIVCAKLNKYSDYKTKNSYWLLFVTVFVTVLATLYTIFIIQYESHSDKMYNLSVFVSFGLLYCTFITLYFYEKILSQTEKERNQEILEQQMKLQAKHIDEILLTQKQIKKLQHDIKNHNISIQGFFENGDYSGGLEYMKNIGHQIYIPDDMIETGNIALDTIINAKKAVAQSKDIAFETNIQIPENVFVDAADMCIIFGNALDNCIEACERIKDKEKKISVSIVYDDNSLICKIVNTKAKTQGKFLHTIKADKENHGFGISNIETALSKYKNVCRFNQTDNEFVLSFVIFNS